MKIKMRPPVVIQLDVIDYDRLVALMSELAEADPGQLEDTFDDPVEVTNFAIEFMNAVGGD